MLVVHDTEENNVLPPQEPAHNDNEDTLAGAGVALSLHSPPTDNSNSQHLNQSHVNCYYNCTQHCLLDYLNDPILDDALIYAGDIPFQYNKIEGSYTEFIGNPIDTVFIAVKRDNNNNGFYKASYPGDTISKMLYIYKKAGI